MKRMLIVFIILFVVTLVLTSCDKDEVYGCMWHSYAECVPAYSNSGLEPYIKMRYHTRACSACKFGYKIASCWSECW